jgi:hypothetical protein
MTGLHVVYLSSKSYITLPSTFYSLLLSFLTLTYKIITMAKLSAWVKKQLRSKPSPKKQSTDQLPFLPSLRPSITLTSFDTQACLFFQVPYDIRSMILSMAFGGRTLHVDIVRQEAGWQWRGAVCYRNMSRLPSMRYAWLGPWNDPCMQWVYERKGKFPEEYNVGIMGFLLSCRQAYTEGIDVLYSANCISIQSEPLLLHLPQLIPPNRLASITSLEMVITAHRIEQDNGRPSFNVDHLKPILDNIVTHCHHLRSFCLSFMVASRGHEILDGPALPLVDAFYRSMQLRNMRVELPTRAYWSACNYESKDDHPYEAPAKGPFDRSLWRSLDGEEPRVQSRIIKRYPYPPLKLPVLDDGDKNVESAGYWLAEGDEGPMQQVVCF